MADTHLNRIKQAVSGTPGTGTITLGAASSGYKALGSGQNGLTFSCLFLDGTAWEIATGCAYTHSGTTLTRGTLEDSSTGSAISLTSAATVSVIAPASRGTVWDRGGVETASFVQAQKLFERRLEAEGVVLNGTHDDAAGVNAALAAIRSTPYTANGFGLLLQMPEGVCGQTIPINIPSWIALRGHGKRGASGFSALAGFTGDYQIKVGAPIGSDTVSFDSFLEHTYINGNDRVATAVYGEGWQEGCGLRGVLISGWTSKGILIRSAANSGKSSCANLTLTDLELYGTDTVTTTNAGIDIEEANGSNLIYRVTNVGQGTHATDSSKQTYGIRVQAGSCVIMATHHERCTYGISVEGNDTVASVIEATAGTASGLGTLLRVTAPKSTAIGLVKNNATNTYVNDYTGQTIQDAVVSMVTPSVYVGNIESTAIGQGWDAGTGVMTPDNRYADLLPTNQLDRNITVALPNTSSKRNITFVFRQDATGGRTVTFDSGYQGAPSVSSGTAGQRLVVSFVQIYGTWTLANSSGWDGTKAITSSGLTQATNKLLGRSTSGTGAVEEITLGTNLSFTGTTLNAAGGGGGGTKTLAVFTPMTSQPPASAFATLDTRNSIAVLDFDAAADESIFWVGVIPEAASLGSGLSIKIHWMATSATSGDTRWRVALERCNTDSDSDSFDTAAEASGTANGTSGIPTVTSITLTTIDSVTAGDMYRLKVTRVGTDATNDTMSGDAELIAVEVRQVA